jgi:hypothetical protein
MTLRPKELVLLDKHATVRAAHAARAHRHSRGSSPAGRIHQRGILRPLPARRTPVAADFKALLAEVTRLRHALTQARLESANRLAAIHAALGAAENGEPGPLDYLRWELPGTGRGRA